MSEFSETPPPTDSEGEPHATAEHRGTQRRSHSRIAAITLALIGLAILGLILFVPAPDGSTKPGQTGPAKNPGPSAAREGLPAMEPEYRPLHALEALIGSLPRRAEFRVVSPEESVAKGKLIVFRWLSEKGGPWKVTILNNKGITLKEEVAREPEYTLSSPKPALYYWTVAKEDTLLHAGRLKVR